MVEWDRSPLPLPRCRRTVQTVRPHESGRPTLQCSGPSARGPEQDPSLQVHPLHARRCPLPCRRGGLSSSPHARHLPLVYRLPKPYYRSSRYCGCSHLTQSPTYSSLLPPQLSPPLYQPLPNLTLAAVPVARLRHLWLDHNCPHLRSYFAATNDI
jgi:hypothetical protein